MSRSHPFVTGLPTLKTKSLSSTQKTQPMSEPSSQADMLSTRIQLPPVLTTRLFQTSSPSLCTGTSHRVTGTDAGGAFTVEDASSGSVSLASRYSNDGNLSTIIGSQYAGVAYFPAALSSTSVIDKEFLPTNRQRLPEVINSADAVNVLSRDENFTQETPLFRRCSLPLKRACMASFPRKW